MEHGTEFTYIIKRFQKLECAFFQSILASIFILSLLRRVSISFEEPRNRLVVILDENYICSRDVVIRRVYRKRGMKKGSSVCDHSTGKCRRQVR